MGYEMGVYKGGNAPKARENFEDLGASIFYFDIEIISLFNVLLFQYSNSSII